MSEHDEQPYSFDHLIHVVDDLEDAMTCYNSLNLPTHTALSIPGFRNAAWGVDDERYVELATIDDWDATADSPYAHTLSLMRPSVEATTTPGLVSFAVHVPDAHATARALEAGGYDVRIADVRFEEKNAGFTEVFISDAPTWFPFFINYDPPRSTIAAMRADHRISQGGDPEPACVSGPDLAYLLVRSDSPAESTRRLAGLLGCRHDETTVHLPGAQIRFTPGAPSGLYGFGVRGAPNTPGTSGDEGTVDVHGAVIERN